MRAIAEAARALDVEPRHLRLPRTEPGLEVALFGGSFNPPHDGHLLVAETALKALGLDQVWWVITPGNPLKAGRSLLPLKERIARCEALARDPRMRITAFEAGQGLRYTADMVDFVLARRKAARFVWLMGADNLRDFHRWQRWRDIAEAVPLAVVDRPGATLSFLSSPTARAYWRFRVDERDAGALAAMRPPAWTFLHGPRSSLSSTALRGDTKGR